MRPELRWSIWVREFFAHMRACGWGERGHFIIFGRVFWIIGMPKPWQAFDADNDNAARSA